MARCVQLSSGAVASRPRKDTEQKGDFDQEKTQRTKATKETELWTSSLEPSHRYEQRWALPILLPTLTTISCTWILGKGSLTWDNALTTGVTIGLTVRIKEDASRVHSYRNEQ